MDDNGSGGSVKYSQASEHTHVRICTYAHNLPQALKSFYDLQSEIEVSNAIAITEAEDIPVCRPSLQDLRSLLDRLGGAVPMTKQATNILNSLTQNTPRW